VMLRFAHWRSARIRTTTRAFATRAQRRRIDNGIIQLKRYGQYDPELHDHLQHQDLVNTVNIVQNNHGSVTRQKKMVRNEIRKLNPTKTGSTGQSLLELRAELLLLKELSQQK